MNSYDFSAFSPIHLQCLDRMIFFGEKMLQPAVTEIAVHYHYERNLLGLGNRLIEPGETVGQTAGDLVRYERLGGLLKYYDRKAA